MRQEPALAVVGVHSHFRIYHHQSRRFQRHCSHMIGFSGKIQDEGSLRA